MSNSYIIQREKYEKNKAIIDEFEATFPLNRFFEKLSDDVKGLNDQLTGLNGLINSNFKKDAIPKGYTLDDIDNLINKISNKIILRENHTTFNDRELELFGRLAEELGYEKYTHVPSSNFVNDIAILTNFSGSIYSSEFFPTANQNFFNQYVIIQHDHFQLNKASLRHTLANSNDIVCCYHSWLTHDSTEFYNIDDWNDLSLENSLNISSELPYEYSIESFDQKYKNNYNDTQSGVKYFPTYLVDPFTKLTFYDPVGFNPANLKNNLEWAKLTNGSSSELFNNYLISLFIIISSNIIIVLLIRLTNWINNG